MTLGTDFKVECGGIGEVVGTALTHLLARVAVEVHRALPRKLRDGVIPVTSKSRTDAKAEVSMSNTSFSGFHLAT